MVVETSEVRYAKMVDLYGRSGAGKTRRAVVWSISPVMAGIEPLGVGFSIDRRKSGGR